MSATREKQIFWALLILSAAIRLAFFLELRNTDLAAVPLLDAQSYHDWAARLVNGDWGRYETYWMAPLYPHLLAVVYVIFGVGSQAALFLQLSLSLLNLVWLHRLANRLAQRLAPRRGTALLALALYALYGAPVFYAGNLLIATVATALWLAVALQATTALKRPTWRNWFFLGVAVGAASLARGNGLILLPLLPLLLSQGVTGTCCRWRDKINLTGALVLGCLLLITPVTLRNLVMADDFVVLTSNGGINLLIGQKAAYRGIFAPVTDDAQAEFDPSMETTLERELGRDLKGSEVSRILTVRAWHEFCDNLDAMPMHYLRKMFRFWNGYELPQIVSYDYYRHVFKSLQLLPLPFFVLSGLGLIGWWYLPQPSKGLFLVLVGGYFLSLMPFFPTSRYRQPIAPLLALSAATYLTAMWQSPGRRKLGLPVAAVLLCLMLPRWTALDPAAVLWQVHLHEASRASKRGRLADTLAFGAEAEQARPGLADTPFHLSLFLEDLGEHAQAIAALKQAAARAPRNRLIPYRMGRNYEDWGGNRKAVAAYERAAALDTNWSYPWFRSGLVLRRAGRPGEALRALQKAHELAPGHKRIRSNLASLYAESGALDSAHDLLLTLTRDYPRYVNGWYNLARVDAELGRYQEALFALATAARLPRLSAREEQQLSALSEFIAKSRPR